MYLKTVILGIGLAILASGCKRNVSLTDASLNPKNTKNSLAGSDTSGLTVSADGTVLLNGKTYRGVGVNYFNAFYRTILNHSDLSYKAGLKYLSDNHIPFIRFSANGFWPSENLYYSDTTTYFRLLDNFVHTADSLHVGLIPSFFFNASAISDRVGEHQNQWGQLGSATIALMRRYTASVVNRYKNSPAIWGWEFGNEMNAYVDLYESAGSFLPRVYPAGGSLSPRTLDDAIRTTTLDTAYNEFARIIKLSDTKHMIFTGNAMPEYNMWHRYHYPRHPSNSLTWARDSTAAQFGNILDAQNPAAIGTLTVHFYWDSTTETGRFTNNDSTLMAAAMSKSISLKRPLFVGEFGAKMSYGAQTQPRFESMLNAIVKNKVPLSALWVYDFSAQDTTFNVTSTNTRAYQLSEIITTNTQLKTQLGY